MTRATAKNGGNRDKRKKEGQTDGCKEGQW